MITSIIFSKDRPLQLDLCISSLKKNFHDTNEIIVIEKYSEKYRHSLMNLKNQHQDVVFYNQSKSIYKDIKDWCLLSNNDYMAFFTDDNIFYIGLKTDNAYEEIFKHPCGVCCVSLRLGLNIKERSFLGNIQEDEPIFHEDAGDVILIPKTQYPYGSYWSYSHSVDGHIFKKSYVMEMMSELYYLDKHFSFCQTPNCLEEKMQRFWTISPNVIVCPKQSVVVNSPNNRVSETHQENISGEKYNYTPEQMLDIYRQGKRIDIDLLDFSSIHCPHQEIDIIKGLK